MILLNADEVMDKTSSSKEIGPCSIDGKTGRNGKHRTNYGLQPKMAYNKYKLTC